MGSTVFKPRLSHWIMGMYWIILIVLIAALILVPLTAGMDLFANILFVLFFSIVALLIIFVIMKAHKMKFTITQTQIIVNGIFRKSIIEKSDIESIQKTPIPFGLRLFGASFLSGWHYFPGIGKAWVSMGNFEDGVMITTKEKKHYIITPQNPFDFIKRAKGNK